MAPPSAQTPSAETPSAETQAAAWPESAPTSQKPKQRAPRGRGRRKQNRELALLDAAQSGQMVAAAGNAIVTAARVGRLLGRSGWRIAKQLPGVNAVEQQAQKLAHTASAEMYRLLEMPHQSPGAATSEEQRVMLLVQDAGDDAAPLRTAMTELLERSTEASDAQSREYLFGTIVSQLVPDEARILAVLGSGHAFAAVDVVSKQVGRSSVRPVLSNASTVGREAGVSLPHNVGIYLGRLHGYGLVDFGTPDHDLDPQFDTLTGDPGVLAARAMVDNGKQGNSKLVRKSVTLSELGAEFWAACAPTRGDLARRSS